MSRLATAAFAGLALSLATLPASAMQLIWRDSFQFPRAASMEWDAELCGLWVAVEGPQLFLLSPGGEVLRSIAPGMGVIRSLTVEEGGLLIADGWGTFQRIDRDGAARGAPFRLNPILTDVEGMQRAPSGDVLVVQDDLSRLLRVSPEGEVLMERLGTAFTPPLEEMQGVALDPMTGNILVVDDNEGLNALVELTPDGAAVLSVTPLSDWGFDAEGVAVHGQTGTLYIGFDSGQRIAVFDYLPTRGVPGQASVDQGPDCPLV